MRLKPILARLREQCPSFRCIEFSRSIEPIDDIDFGLPAAFLYTSEEVSTGNDGTQFVVQARTNNIVILIAAETGRGDDEPLEDAREEIAAALSGWSSDSNCEPWIHSRGQLLALSGRLTWWLDIYSNVEHRS